MEVRKIVGWSRQSQAREYFEGDPVPVIYSRRIHAKESESGLSSTQGNLYECCLGLKLYHILTL